MFCFCDTLSHAIFTAGLYPYVNKVSTLVWDKQVIGPGHPFRRQHELIAYGRMATGWSKPEKPAVRKDNSLPDVLACPRVTTSQKVHRAEKPTRLLTMILSNVAGPGARILDPFAGSGTTGLAAKALGMHATLIEIEEKPC